MNLYVGVFLKVLSVLFGWLKGQLKENHTPFAEPCAVRAGKELTFEAKDASVVWLEHGDPSEGLAPVQTVTRLDAFLHMHPSRTVAHQLSLVRFGEGGGFGL